MGPSLTADAPTLIEWSLKEPRPTSFFTGRLGLPQSDQSKTEKGRPSFEGNAADSCKDLYQSTLKGVKLLTQQFRAKEALRVATVQQRDELIAKTTGPILSEYGNLIWGTAEPYATRTGPAYPKYLKHNNSNDRERIMLYLFCWIIARAIRRLPKDPNKSRKAFGRPSQSGALIFDLSSDNDDGNNSEDTESIEHAAAAAAGNSRDHIQGSGSNGTGNNATQLMSMQSSQVPVAQMLPKRGVVATEAIDTGKSPTVTNSLASTTTAEDALLNEHNESAGVSDSQLPRVSSRRIKRRGFSYPFGEAPENKRPRCVNARCPAAGSAIPTPRLQRGTASNFNEIDNSEPPSYPSPLSLGSMEAGEESNERNFPNVPNGDQPLRQSTGENTSQAIDTSDRTQASEVENDVSLQETEGRTGEQYGRNAQREDDDTDDDSVQGHNGDRRSVTTSSKTTPSSTRRPRLVVPLKVMTPPEDLKYQQWRLTSKLSEILRAKLQQPNTVLLSSTIEVMDTLSRTERLRLMEKYGEDFSHYQGAFDQWLQCLKNILGFYEITGFRGDLSTRNAFMDNMPNGGPPEVVSDAFYRGRVSLIEWQRRSGIDDMELSKNVASVLFNLAPWGSWTQFHRLESWTQGFTEELLAWFQ